jgi:hypothetical protein
VKMDTVAQKGVYFLKVYNGRTLIQTRKILIE